MSSGLPYQGVRRKLVLAFDVGTTFSGVSYSVLDPGLIPKIEGVTRYPAQQKVGGDSKIPSIIYYDQDGNVQAVGAEALQESFLEQAEEEEWIKVEWFKLHLRPKSLASSHITDVDVPPLPNNKSPLDVLADFLGYLYRCARGFIQEANPNSDFWSSLEGHVDFVLSLPNGWEGAQQAQIRRAAVLAGLIPESEAESRLQFVTEGEASLHFCVKKGLLADAVQNGEGIIIVDAGGGTIDLSAYRRTTSPTSFEEIAPPECRLQGSVFVSRRARAYLEEKLQGSRYGKEDDVRHMTNCFDKTTKLSFRSSSDPSFIRFGSGRDKDPNFGIRSGQIKLPGAEIAGLFDPSIQGIVDAIQEQRKNSLKPITTVFLVGGFAASDWLFAKLQEHLQPLGLNFCRPDGHLNKAVADGAVSFYLDHFVSARVSRFTYGVDCFVEYDPKNHEHQDRSQYVVDRPSGKRFIPHGYSAILSKGTRVAEEKEFRRDYSSEAYDTASFKSISIDIICYKGESPKPQWMDDEPDMFSTLCTVVADTSQLAKSMNPVGGKTKKQHYILKYSIVLMFGLTELKAQITWTEKGVEKRSPARILYDEDVEPRRK